MTRPIPADLGIILVDHGSKHAEANDQLYEVVTLFKELTGASRVEAAHMELATPSVADAFATLVEHGARRIVIHPYFLAPGQHSTLDIPRLAAEAADQHPGVPYTVTEPLGLHLKLGEVVLARIEQALENI